MYSGMASGSTSAISSSRRPGNTQVLTSHAVATPMNVVISPTPSMRSAVVAAAPGSTVATRWSIVPSPLGSVAITMIATIGIAASAMRTAAATVRPGWGPNILRAKCFIQWMTKNGA